jgi:hypothetical protein
MIALLAEIIRFFILASIEFEISNTGIFEGIAKSFWVGYVDVHSRYVLLKRLSFLLRNFELSIVNN